MEQILTMGLKDAAKAVGLSVWTLRGWIRGSCAVCGWEAGCWWNRVSCNEWSRQAESLLRDDRRQ